MHTYCINVPTCTERRARMTERFGLAGITNYHFVEAINYTDDVVEEYRDETMRDPMQARKDTACFMSHMKAIKEFIASGDEWGLICEDDILFANDFLSKLEVVRAEGANYQCIALGYMLTGGYEFEFEKPHLMSIQRQHIWGGQAYLLTHEYAKYCIRMFDQPMEDLAYFVDEVTAELPMRYSRGVIAYPALVIEDCIDSVRKPADAPYHIKHFCAWDYMKNFALNDPRGLSPMRLFPPIRAWGHYVKQLEIAGVANDGDIEEITRMLSEL